jgi:hypothetical protein
MGARIGVSTRRCPTRSAGWEPDELTGREGRFISVSSGRRVSGLNFGIRRPPYLGLYGEVRGTPTPAERLNLVSFEPCQLLKSELAEW